MIIVCRSPSHARRRQRQRHSSACRMDQVGGKLQCAGYVLAGFVSCRCRTATVDRHSAAVRRCEWGMVFVALQVSCDGCTSRIPCPGERKTVCVLHGDAFCRTHHKGDDVQTNPPLRVERTYCRGQHRCTPRFSENTIPDLCFPYVVPPIMVTTTPSTLSLRPSPKTLSMPGRGRPSSVLQQVFMRIVIRPCEGEMLPHCPSVAYVSLASCGRSRLALYRRISFIFRQ